MVTFAALDALGRFRGPRGCKPKLPLGELLQALLFHFLFPNGTCAEHLRQLTGRQRAESTLSERREALPWIVFTELLLLALRPLAHLQKHPQAFWRGLRLTAWDGSQFSLTNTPQNLEQFPKAKARRLRAAWAKITVVVLLEIGLHNPLAAAIGREGESEMALTRRLLASLPAAALLLADRLTSCTSLLADLLHLCQDRGSHFLVRIRKDLTGKVLQRLRDGSTLIQVAVRDPRSRKIIDTILLREIQVRVSGRGSRHEVLRLWTDLLDPKDAPALELARLYAQRWEQELYWRQLKLELRKSDLLQSHTPDTAAQEVALLVVASALLAQERSRAAAGQVPVLDISFLKCLELLRPFWVVLCLAGDLLSYEQIQAFTRRIQAEIRRCVKPKRRARSCARAVRQPIKSWPRLLRPKYATGPWTYKIINRKR